MSKYNTLAWDLKRDLMNFSKKITKEIGKPEQKLVSNMLYGIAESGSCHLSKIGRALKEKISLKKTIERLSRGLKSFSKKKQQKLLDNYTESIQREIDKQTVFVLDGSDVTKPCSEKLECLSLVRDGSTGEIEKGYFTFEIAALTKGSKSPVPVYDRVYSAAEKGFISETDEMLTGLKYLSKTFGNKGIRTLDRGYDSLVYYEYFLKAKEFFIIRATKNRSLIHNGNKLNIMELANRRKGKFCINFKSKKGETISCKTSIIPISLLKFPNVQLNLVIVYGFGKDPMLLLTNLKSDDSRLANTIARVYLMRWRIEEYFRFKKQQYDFENFRVRSLNSIRVLHRILTLLAGFIGLLSEKRDESLFVMELIVLSKRIYRPKPEKWKRYFLHYAIADGFFELLRRCSSGFTSFFAKPKYSAQLSFF